MYQNSLSLNIYTYILLFSLQGVIRILEVSQLNFLWPTRKMTRTTTTFQRQRNIYVEYQKKDIT